MPLVIESSWIKMSKEISSISDGLGTPIDKGIKNTVIALRLLGYETIGSCEGHLDHGTGAPWVHIMIEEAERLETKLWRKRKRISAIESININRQVKIMANEQLRDLRNCLRNFYRDRKVRLDLKLAIYNPGGGLVILESRGVNTLLWKNLLEPRYSERLLMEYQSEIMLFTDYLKKSLKD